MAKAKRVLIVGHGIGGATLAFALARKGIAADSVDVKAEIPVWGSGICLLNNTMRALGEIGLADICRESGQPFEVFKQLDAAGNLLASFPAPPGCGIRRPDLACILESAAIKAGATLKKALTVSDFVDAGDHVEVSFSDGSAGNYDLVVAADGAYSKLRDKVFGPQVAPKFAGTSAWRFNAPRPEGMDGFWLHRSPDNKRVVGILPTSKDGCYMFFLENSKEHLRFDNDKLHELLKERLAAFSAPMIRAGLAQVTRPEQVLFRPFDIILVPAPWHRGRVVLLGDAAHSPTPQLTSGGGMAIEDAVILAEYLSSLRSVEEALNAYSKRRYERVKTVWDTSLALCRNEQEPVPSPERAAELLMQGYQFLAQPM